MMNMDDIYNELEHFFMNGQTAQAEDFLIAEMKLAQQEGDYNRLIMLLNEMIGLCRETGQKDKSLAYAFQVLELMERLGMKDSQAYATSLLNVATACRAAGKYTEAYQLYMDVFPLYEKWLPPGDYHFASLYNNMSLLFQETGEYERAAECQGKALSVLSALSGKEFEIAVTHTNMASTLCKIAEIEGSKEIASEAAAEAECALNGFKELQLEDVHTAAAYAAYADAMTLLKEYEYAKKYYTDAMSLIVRLVGKTESYERVAEKLTYVETFLTKKVKEEKQELSGLQLSKAYYEEYGKPMLVREFEDYFDRMAIGLCGEGSDCLGYDDEISTDHDHGPGFAIWISSEDYAQIGEQLQKAYEQLPKIYHGYERIDSQQGKERTGVCTYEQYFERILGISQPPRSEAEWLYVEEYALCTAVSGEIFYDPKGTFSAMLEEIKEYYPKGIWERKLKQEMELFYQNGLYNYSRMCKRGAWASANLLLAKAAENASKIVYLLEKKYAPHTKWLIRGLNEMPQRKEETYLISELLEHMGTQMQAVQENVKRLEKLQKIFEDVRMQQLVDEIVQLEWNAFDKVKNEGGRAGCQDDWTTFEIMRKSQYMTWTEEMLWQYRADFLENKQKGWNLITEKYARMMESTAPDAYEMLKEKLPVVTEDKKRIMEEIIAIQVTWMEQFAEKYPKVAGNARVIHSFEDTPYDTSYETYLRGELATYSDAMLLLYGAFIAALAREGKNLAYLTMEHTVHLYGYEDVELAESKMW